MYSTESERNGDFFLQLKSQVLKSGTRFSFAAFSTCARNRHLGMSIRTSVPADLAGRSCKHHASSAGTSVTRCHICSFQAQRWHIPAIDWLQKHLQGWGRAKSRQIWQVCVEWDQTPWKSHLFLWMAQVSVLPQDPCVYNPYKWGSHLRGDVQGVISSSRITLADADN